MSIPNGTTINSLTIASTYTNTLTLNNSLTVSNGITIKGGNIAQPNGTGSSINCEGDLSWTGGTVGSQTNGASNLNLYGSFIGVQATIGGSGGTETLGDNLYINAYASVTITGESGNTLLITNSANINNSGVLSLNESSSMKGIINQSGSNGSIINNSGGLINATGATGTSLTYVPTCIPIVNNAGATFNIGGANGTTTWLWIPGKNPQNGVSFMNNGGTVNLYTAADILAYSGFTQQGGGSLNISGANGVADLCYLPGPGAGNVIINGGTIHFSTADQALEAGVNFTMTGGNLFLTFDATAVTDDMVESYNGSITINNGTIISVSTVNIPPGGMPHVKWVIFEIENGTGDVTIASKVTYAFSGWETFTKVGNGTPTFYLQS